MNFIGWDGHNNCCGAVETPFWGNNVNTPFVFSSHPTLDTIDDEEEETKEGPIKKVTTAGLFMTSQDEIKDSTRHGSVALSTIFENADPPEVGVITGVLSEKELLESFAGRNFEDPVRASPTVPSTTTNRQSYMGAVIQPVSVPPSTSKSLVFVLSWYFPNRPCTASRDNLPKDVWGNKYSTLFHDAKDVACRFSVKSNDLMKTTRLFVDILYGSTIPWPVLESAAGRMACLRSPTMFWTADGKVFGNEGNECCPFNCSHVNGYTTILERLFPGMQRFPM